MAIPAAKVTSNPTMHMSEQHRQLYHGTCKLGQVCPARTTLIVAGHKGALGGDCPKQNSIVTLVLGCTWTLALLGGTEASPCPSSCHTISALQALMRLLKA